jgi:hypothetical protein
MSNQTETEKRIQQVYDSLNAESIPKFITLAEYTLQNNPSNQYYDVVANIVENVKKWRSITFKQFRAVYFFIENCRIKAQNNNNSAKTF